MKVTTNTQVSVDGVMEGNGGQRHPKGILLQVYRPNGRPEYAA